LLFLLTYFVYKYFFVQPKYTISISFLTWAVASFGPKINRQYWRGNSQWKSFGLDIIEEQLILCKVNNIFLDVKLLPDWVFKLQITRFHNVVGAFPYTHKNILRVIISKYSDSYNELKQFTTKGIVVFTNGSFCLLTEKGIVDNFFIKVPENLVTHKVLFTNSPTESQTISFIDDLNIILQSLIRFVVSVKSAYSSFKVGKYWITVKEIIGKDSSSSSSTSSKSQINVEQNINIDIDIDNKQE